MMNIEIRLASNYEGDLIRDLVYQNGFDIDWLTWDNIYPYWLVAVVDEEIQGCIQVCPSLPIGRIEILSIKKDITHTPRARIVKMLVSAATVTLKEFGAQAASSIIPHEMKSYKRVLKKHFGAVNIGTGSEFAKRL
jgi:hypothetical protein